MKVFVEKYLTYHEGGTVRCDDVLQVWQKVCDNDDKDKYIGNQKFISNCRGFVCAGCKKNPSGKNCTVNCQGQKLIPKSGRDKTATKFHNRQWNPDYYEAVRECGAYLTNPI